jgi:hypothetical protein
MPYAPLGYQTPIPSQGAPQSMMPPAPPPQAPMSFAPMQLGPASQWLGQPGAMPSDLQPGMLPPDQQSTLIAQIQAMLASDDPRQKALGEALLAQHGRSLLAMGANRATWGLSDQLMGGGPAREFGNRLTRAARPDAAHDAEMIGAALGFVPLGLAGRGLGLLRAGIPQGTPPTPPTLPSAAPTGGQQSGLEPPRSGFDPYQPGPGEASGWLRRLADEQERRRAAGSPMPEQPGSPAPEGGWPKIVEDLRTKGFEPPPTTKTGKDVPRSILERILNKYYDYDRPRTEVTGKRSPQEKVEDIKGIGPSMDPVELQKLLEALKK